MGRERGDGLVSALLKTGFSIWRGSAQQTFDSLRFGSHSWNATLQSEVLPAWQSMLGIGTQVGQDAGETVLASDRFFKLSYLPPARGAAPQPLAIFHAGGSIPYGDRIFRLLPEYNFYDRFLERGLPVYAMELHGDRDQNPYNELTLEEYVDSLERFSAIALTHNGGRKLALEGYCGNGSQALAFLAARPAEADRCFSLFASFVAPVDGSKCGALAEAARATPAQLEAAGLAWWEQGDGYVPGDHTRLSIDRNLKAAFHKTPLGYFCAGWQRDDLNAARSAEDLTPRQRRDLAGAYWVSPDCARRFPVPVDLTRYTSRLFAEGVSGSGALPASYRGAPLSLQRLRDETSLQVVGFYGGQDPIVSDATGHCLQQLLGDRYHHVVHPTAGHITYVMSPKAWDPDRERGLRPNPVDLLLELDAAAQATPRRKPRARKKTHN